jgi:ABC-type transport system involved in cytochrome c biogenesis permease component
MAKTSAWLITLVGVVLLLPLIGVDIGADLSLWIIALAWFLVGITKLARNYGMMKKK